MKKSFFFALAAAGLALASCSNEIEAPAAGKGDVAVTFSTALPYSINSRAYADGTTAKNLYYAVYKAGETAPVLENVTEGDVPQFIDLETTLTLNLVSGQAYDIVFWAAADNDTHYSFDPATATVTAKYADAKAQDEAFDAFYAKESFTVTGSAARSVTLHRPFSQLNIGTSDLANSLVDVANTGVTVSGVYSQFDLLAGDVTGEAADVEFALAAIPADESFPVQPEKYEYVAMNYVLVSATDTELHTVTFAHDNTSGTNPRTFDNVPLKPNYRTNIFGALFTSEIDYNINIDKEFETPDNDMEIWDGSVKTPVAIDKNAKTIAIANEAEFAWLAKAVNEAETGDTDIPANFKGWTVSLDADLDLGGLAWTPIGSNADNAKKFTGIFDGQNHTIVGLNVKQGAAYHAAGLFGALNGTVRNLTISGASIESLSSAASNGGTSNGIAVVAGSIYPTGLVENVKVLNASLKGNRYTGTIAGYCYGNVKDCSVDGITIVVTPDNLSGGFDNGDKAGGIIGYQGEGSYTISGNSAKNVTITGYRDLGGIIGGAQTSKISGNTADNITIIVDQNTNGYGSKAPNAGGLIGRNLGGHDLATVGTATNVTISMAATPESFASTVASAAAGSTIVLGNGTYTFASAPKKALNFVGNGDNTVIDLGSQLLQMAGDVSFTNLKITNEPGNFRGFHGATNAVYTDCSFDGVFFIYNKNEVYNNCTFTVDGNYYPVWTYGGISIEFNNCTFNQPDKGKAILAYGDTNGMQQDITVNGCKFNTAAASGDKCAIEIHSEHNYFGTLTINNSSVAGTGWNETNGGLWREVDNSKGENGEPTTRYTVIVDGTTVQTSSI